MNVNPSGCGKHLDWHHPEVPAGEGPRVQIRNSGSGTETFPAHPRLITQRPHALRRQRTTRAREADEGRGASASGAVAYPEMAGAALRFGAAIRSGHLGLSPEGSGCESASAQLGCVQQAAED